MFSYFKNFKKQILQQMEKLEDRVHQSDLFNTLKERFQALSPGHRQIIKYSSLSLGLLCLFSLPFSYFYSSSGYLQEFKEKEALSQELLKTGGSSSFQAYQKSPMQVKRILQNIVGKYQSEGYLIVEKGAFKMKGGDISPHNIEISVRHLNIKQVAALGEKIDNLGFLRIHKLKIKENTDYKNHYDTDFSVLFFPLLAQKTPQRARLPNQNIKKIKK